MKFFGISVLIETLKFFLKQVKYLLIFIELINISSDGHHNKYAIFVITARNIEDD